MNVVLDTNIFVSAFLWGGKPREVLERAIEGKDCVFISRDILSEIRNVLRRPKFGIAEEYVDYFVKELEELSELVFVNENIKNACRDIDDNAVLSCAVAARAPYIITGDDDLLVLKEYRGVRIVRCSEYPYTIS